MEQTQTTSLIIARRSHGSTTLAQRRKRDRMRKREERARRKELGIPKPPHVDFCITEAVSFALMQADRSAFDRSKGQYPINWGLIVEVSIHILHHRFGYDRKRAEDAVRSKMAPRPEHRQIGRIPSTRPLPGQPVYPGCEVQTP